MRGHKQLDELAKRLAGLHPRARLHLDRAELESVRARLMKSIELALTDRHRSLVDQTRRLTAQSPGEKVHRGRSDLNKMSDRLRTLIRRSVDARRHEFAGQAGKLDAMSPLRVLERGYSVTRRKARQTENTTGPMKGSMSALPGPIVSDASQVRAGDAVTVRLHRGELDCVVQSVALSPSPSEDSDPE